MDVSQYHALISRKIKGSKDPVFLENILQLILNEQDNSYVLSEEEMLMVEESRNQLKAGDGISHEEVRKRVREWLEK